MELKETLNVPATFFFDKIADSALYDVQRHTGKRLNRKQLKNFEYVKQFNKNARAKIKINEFLENVAYGFTTSTTRNTFEVAYYIEAIDDKSCEVTYKETTKSYGIFQKINDNTVGLLWGLLRKRRFKSMLRQIEGAY